MKKRFKTCALFLRGAFAVSACASSGGEGAKDPDRMSDSEYDVARDLWLRRNSPREALEHALKAVELNDQNAEPLLVQALLAADRGSAVASIESAESAAFWMYSR